MRVAPAALALAGCRSILGIEDPALVAGDAGDANTEQTGDAPLDVTVDASFSLASCPPTYTAITGAPSRYRIITALATFWPIHADCNDDLLGATHAASIGSQAELTALDGAVDLIGGGSDRYYLGGVQDPTALMADSGWITFDGATLDSTLWNAAMMEPDDGADQIENRESQLVMLDRIASLLHDGIGTGVHGGICECDGIMIDPLAAAYVAADPNNPN